MSVEVTYRHFGLAHAVLHRHGVDRGNTPDYDDHVSACLEGLAKAAIGFRPDGGASFETYATTRMWGAHLDYLRAQDHLKRTHRAHVNTGKLQDPGAPTEYLVEYHDEIDPIDEHDAVLLRDSLDRAMRTLRDREATTLRLVHQEDWTLDDVAWLLGVTPSGASRIAKQARDKMRAELAPILMDAA